MGVEFLKKLVVDVAKVMNVVSKFANGGGIFSLLDAREPAMELVRMDYAAVLAELKDMDPIERAQVEVAFTSALSLAKPGVQMKVEEAVAVVEKAVAVIAKGVGMFGEVVAVVNEFKKLVGA